MRAFEHIFWIALVASGCVGMKKHTALQNDLDALRVSMTEQLADKSSQVESLNVQLEQLRAVSAELQAQIEALETEKAGLLKDRSSLNASVQEMEEALRDLRARKEATDARVSQYQSLLSKFGDLIDAGRLTVKIVDGRMVVELASDVLFDSGVADLNDAGRESLLEVASVLAEISDRQFQVEGHTDNVPINNRDFPSNWELGSARAITVVRTLHEGGVPMDRLSAASYADNRPVGANEEEVGRASNRRIEIVVVPDLSLLPGSDELEQLASNDAEQP
ncbi:MAG: OmpA family protein [Myxococcales bacterium]|nr:OmpA family protein [Myxococcales bacterium]